MWCNILHHVLLVYLACVLHAVVSDSVRIQTLCNLTFYAVESSAADEQNVACIYMYVVLVRMLASSLWRHVDYRSLKKFEHTLLYTFTAYVSCNAWVVSLTCYLVYLVDKYYATFCSFKVVVCNLKQSCEDALYILTHIACLGKHRSIHYGERHVEQFGNSPGKKCLSCTC